MTMREPSTALKGGGRHAAQLFEASVVKFAKLQRPRALLALRVYVGSNDGTIYALDAKSGCIYWMFQAKALVRGAAVIGPGHRAYIGDLNRTSMRWTRTRAN
jgi:glucose dehydrogenase